MIDNPPISALIYMFNHYREHANNCWQHYNLVDGYFMYDYYMEMADIYERGILAQLL